MLVIWSELPRPPRCAARRLVSATRSTNGRSSRRAVRNLSAVPALDGDHVRIELGNGKERVPAILQMTGLSLPPVIPWNRSQAATEATKHERNSAAVNERRGPTAHQNS